MMMRRKSSLLSSPYGCQKTVIEGAWLSSTPFAEEEVSNNPFAGGKRRAGLEEYFTSVNAFRSAPPPVLNFPPLTPPQQERVEHIRNAKLEFSRKQARFQEKGEDARLSTLVFNQAEMEEIHQATITAFRADLLYQNDKSKTKEFRHSNQGPTDIIDFIDGILEKNNKYPGGLGDPAKEGLVAYIQKEDQFLRIHYS
jgi:hypothetical protein